MKKFSELVKKLTVVGNDYVPIIDSQAESDADKNKATLFSTILTYLRGETIRNTGTVTDEGMYALDAKQGNPNVAGSLAARTLNLETRIRSVSSGSVFDIAQTGVYYITNAVTDKPVSNGGLLIVAYHSANNRVYLFEPNDPATAIYLYRYSNGTANGWYIVAKRDEVKTLGGITAIPANADLNTYTTPGEYYVGTNATAATLTNCPSTNAGRLTVENSIASGGTYLKQTYAHHYSSANGQYTWVRMSGNSGSSWSSWSLVEGAQLTTGTINTTSVPNDTLTLIGSLDMPPGVYLVYLYVNFASASAGWRGAQIYGATLTSLGRTATRVNAIASAQTTVGNSYIFNWTASSTTCNFYVYQNCGASINCTAEYRYVRLA